MCETSAETYRLCFEVHAGQHADDHYGETPIPEDDEEFELGKDEKEDNPAEWEDLARSLPGRPLDIEDIELLINREMDLLHDWSPHVSKCSTPRPS